MINFTLLVNKLRKTRLIQWYDQTPENQRQRIIQEVSQQVVERQSKGCNVIEWRDKKLIFRRYASLYFIFCVDLDDNELMMLEGIQYYVECLDKYFGNVCELDLIFNYSKAYNVLDEMVIGGYFSESSKRTVLKAVQAHDQLEAGGEVK
ncbi:Sigma_adaptin [Hexamita inflata]|uniref:AP complex subunit sigma n=1 Tax=Hexamita inflata TaxID=28002 RepID=A0AA86PFU8_9EUKA|nr:Sigma adaptin [Hexamita inflata]CAI9937263.1 Sigma adaptin [Hexamita inflata]CAI9938610.1 Sigma adaptin [Hexamita inflata]CAI9946877.1 Sigma adaptin [Hexamita inflata]CAI9967235.1 Sigma adaptin [Hexamita inflata]